MLSTYCFSLIFEFPQNRLSATVTFAISDSRKRRAYILQIDFYLFPPETRYNIYILYIFKHVYRYINCSFM